ncbi:MAG: DUF4251 domain-containing protein [Bacteroidota bacterium]|nr:DUF4251 domain-containing protein [Bacteroidota bacterium]
MRSILLIIIALFLSTGINAQHTKLTKEQKQEVALKKKAERNAKIDSTYKETAKLLEGRRFILQADYLRNRSGYQRPSSQTLNFISIDSLAAVIQIGSNQAAGYNGVGGITNEGKVTNWKLDKNDKKKTFTLNFTVPTNFDVYDIVIYIDYEKRASATITGMRAGRITYEGYLRALEDATIFKGMSH